MISILNLDQTLPIADSYHATNTSGRVRFINVSDANGLQAMQRYMGDAMYRSTLVEGKINELINAFNSNPYTSGFDDTLYAKTDGSHAFNAPVKGVTPKAQNDLSTKGYVDTTVEGFGNSLRALSSRIDLLELRLPLTRTSDWVEYVWNARAKTHLEFTLTPVYADLTNVAIISLVERLNLGTEEEPNYVYMQYMAGNSTNFKVDAMWLDDTNSNKLHVLLPNDVAYPDYPPSSGYGDIQNFNQRHLRAVVTHMTGACPTV